MALPLLAPVYERKRQAVVQRGSKAVLRLVPELETGKAASNRSLIIFGTFVGSAVLTIYLLLNSLATKDAFTLNQLQMKNQKLVSQKDEINRQISALSTPDKLAAEAKALGMVPAKDISYLEISNG